MAAAVTAADFTHCLRAAWSSLGTRSSLAAAAGGASAESRAVSALSYQSQRGIVAGGHDGRRSRRAVARGVLGQQRRRHEFWKLAPHAAVKEEQQHPTVHSSSSTLKGFLEELKSVGRVRLIVNTGVGVLESVTSLEKLYYHEGPRGEYANVMSREDNVDFHLLVEKVASARLVRGKSMRGGTPTCMVRFMDEAGSVAVSVLVMWKLGTDGEYDPGQVQAFEGLVEKYGEEVEFRSGP